MSEAQNPASLQVTATTITALILDAPLAVTFEALEAKIEELQARLTAQGAEMAELKRNLLAEPARLRPLPTSQTSVKATRTGSRRKLLKRLGYSAVSLAAASAAGAGIASSPEKEAQAASGDYFLLGNPNIASTGSYLSQTVGTTTLSSSNNPNAVVWADYNVSGQTQVNPSTALSIGFGLAATATGAIGGYFQGDRAPLFLQAPASAPNPPQTAGVGAPNSGTHQLGEVYLDYYGFMWNCVKSGSPGVWSRMTSPFQLFPSVIRIYTNLSATSSTSYNNIDVSSFAPRGIGAVYGFVIAAPTSGSALTLYASGGSDSGIANYLAPTIGVLNGTAMFIPVGAADTSNDRKFNIHSYLNGQIYVDLYGYLY